MKMVKWDPFRELEEMSTRLNTLFGRYPLKAPEEAMALADWVPVVDIKETPEEYLVKVELPGINKEEVKVAVDKGVLSIRGERKLEKEETGKKYHRIERAYGTFLRSFTLPEGIEEKKLLANYKDGVLEVHLPKAPAAQPKPIEVKVA